MELLAANGEQGEVLEIYGEAALVEFPPRSGESAPRYVEVSKVKFRRALPVCPQTLLQRTWLRWQLPLQIGYARTAHKAQGITLRHPTRVDVINRFKHWSGTTAVAVPSIIYVIISRAQSVSQLYFERRRDGRIFEVADARPDPEALAYHLAATAAYRPLAASVAAVGGDDTI